MRTLLLALACALALTLPARAATAYMLNFTQFSPYQRYSVAGPFDTMQECMSVESQQSYVSGGTYSCDVFFY